MFNKILAIAVLAVFSRTAYAGPAADQLGLGDGELNLPSPTAAGADKQDPLDEIGILHTLMYENLSSCGGSTVRHPQNNHLLFITAAHCVKLDESFLIGLGKSTFVEGARGGVILEVPNNRIIAYYPEEAGDVAVFDLNGLKIEGQDDRFIKILKVKKAGEAQGTTLLNYGAVGGFSDLAVRNCTFGTIAKDYENGIQLARITCSIPDELRDMLAATDSRQGEGTSGSPVVEENDPMVLAGIVRGALFHAGDMENLSKMGIAVFDLKRILKQQQNLSSKEIRKRIARETSKPKSDFVKI
ncbi:MAG: hypothetical protein WCW52_04360 [Elusimicrobiales bacterium]|jgi:hypothetical protein